MLPRRASPPKMLWEEGRAVTAMSCASFAALCDNMQHKDGSGMWLEGLSLINRASATWEEREFASFLSSRLFCQISVV